MTGEWTLVEYRPGRYAKVTDDGTFLEMATEGEVLRWFEGQGICVTGSPKVASAAEPTPAMDMEAVQAETTASPQERVTDRGAMDSDSAPVSLTAPQPPDVLEDTPPEPPAPDLFSWSRSAEMAAQAAEEETPAVMPEEVSEDAHSEAGDEALGEDEPGPQAAAQAAEEETPAIMPEEVSEDAHSEAGDEAPGEDEPGPQAAAQAAEEETPVIMPEEVSEDAHSEAGDAGGDEAPGEDKAGPQVAALAAEESPQPSVSPVKPATGDHGAKTAAPVVDEKDGGRDQDPVIPASGAVDRNRWLWVDPRLEPGYQLQGFDLAGFLERAIALFRNKEWTGGQPPQRLAVHPTQIDERLAPVAEALELEVIGDPLVSQGTYRLALSKRAHDR